LQDPRWWFTGLFFIVIALLLPPLFRFLGFRLRMIVRKLGARSKRKIKRMRRNPLLIMRQMGKTSSLLTAFLVVAFGYEFWVLILASASGGRIPIATALLWAVPVLGLEVAWLTSDEFTKELIKMNARIGERTVSTRIVTR
jgi:hypothetical protein